MDWQTIVAGIVVALAAAWLLRRMWRTLRRGLRGDASASACGSCSKATQPSRMKETSVVSLGDKKRPE